MLIFIESKIWFETKKKEHPWQLVQSMLIGDKLNKGTS